MRQLLCFLLISFAAVVRGHEGDPGANAFPFKFSDGLLWVEVRVPETDRVLNFLLDSGAEASVVDLKTARALGLNLGTRVAVRGVHVSTEAYWSTTRSAKAADVPLPNRFLAMDLTQLSSSCEQHVDGLIGMDFFRNKVVQLDFKAGEVRLNAVTKKDVSTKAVPLEVRRCGMCIKASIDQTRPVWFRLDTGCASGLQWVVGRQIPEGCTSKVAVGLAQLGIPQTKTTVKIGSETLANVETGLHDTPIFEGESGLVGNGVLGQFETVTIDAAGGRLLLGPRRP